MSANSTRKWLSLIGLGTAFFVVAWFLFDNAPASESAEEILRRAKEAASGKSFARAEEIALTVPERDPLWIRSRILAGEYATRAERFQQAIEHYRSIPRDGTSDAILAAYSLAEVCRHIGRLEEAEENYLYVVREQPDHVSAHSRLAILLAATGQRWEALPHYFELVRLGNWSVEELVILADLERPLDQSEYLMQSRKHAPGDLLVDLGLASVALFEQDAAVAEQKLRDVLNRDPDRLSGQAMLGELLLLKEDEVFSAWLSQLPKSAAGHPEIWLVRGLRYRQTNQLEAAVRCFWEAVRLEPNHRRANYHLGQTLIALEQPAGEEFLQRADLLFELTGLLDRVLNSKGRNEEAFHRVAELLYQTGRSWEAWAWATSGQQKFPQSGWPASMIADLQPTLTEDAPRTLASADLTRTHDFSSFPLPDLIAGRDARSSHASSERVRREIRFENEAEHAGIQFVYFNGDEDLEKPGARMFEQNGGGVAVIDYDRDNWPDLVFAQGSPWPEGSRVPAPDPAYANRCFRNRSGSRFEEVAKLAGLDDLGYGQGIAVGDFDNDGFPDLYVANIGRNCLYRNNGDGTFADVSRDAGLQAEQWTASCLIADLNFDGSPDLFDVNYLEGKDVYTLRCQGQACSPSVFPGALDRLLISRGDGGFESIPGAAPEDDTKGLGIVAIAIDRPGRLSLFISNDQVPNHLLMNRPHEAWPFLKFENEALLRGVALNEDGLTMACMGIAAADADGNGLYDLFVTNFKDEANTFYSQDRAGLFVDYTKIAGLFAPSYQYVGWGTQFFDAELDGDPDLVVVNGHVEDHRPTGGLFHMPVQFFVNEGQARFRELDTSRAGSLFEKTYLGRGLSRLDWNQDGRMDFAFCNINDSAALATNRTSEVGHWFNLRLTATRSARDAVGAIAILTSDGIDSTQQLLAGDGYMSSNERMLQFGLGRSERVEKLVVNWPSGQQLTVSDLPVDVTLDLVEGKRHATLWLNQEPHSFEVR